jgi:hypothetical protein
MSNTDLLGYIGTITGVIGAITGIAGAAMGYVSYRRTENLKALDLRLDLRKSVSDLMDEIQSLPDLLATARKSRAAVAAATGRTGSGAMQQWVAQLDADEESLAMLNERLTKLNVDHSAATHAELETRLVETHSLKSACSQLQEKYEAWLAEDNRERDHIREDMRARTGPPR